MYVLKRGHERYAAENGIALVMPDTSPRGDEVADEPDRYDLGKGAGFYVNATQEPWVKHYQMYDYVTTELPSLIEQNFPVMAGVKSISGHSMGGHGALICALKIQERFDRSRPFRPFVTQRSAAGGKVVLRPTSEKKINVTGPLMMRLN